MGINSVVEEQTVSIVNWLNPVFEVMVGTQKYIEFVIQCDVSDTGINEEAVKLLNEFTDQPYPTNTSITWLNIPPLNGNIAHNVISARIPSTSMMNPYHDGCKWFDMTFKRLMNLGLNPKTVNESMFGHLFAPLFGLKDNELTTEEPTSNEQVNLAVEPDQVLCGIRYSKFLTAKSYPAWCIAENALQGENVFEDELHVNVWQMTTANNEALHQKLIRRKAISYSDSMAKFMPKNFEMDDESALLSKDTYIVRVSRSIWCIRNSKFDGKHNDRLKNHWKDNSLPESHFDWSESLYMGLPELLRVMPIWDCADNGGQSIKESATKRVSKTVTNEMATALMRI